MINRRVDRWLDKMPQLDQVGHKLAQTVHNTVLSGGKQVWNGVDVLHGTWLGHPLHPVLTDAVIGAWAFGTVLDMISLTKRSKGTRRAADRLVVMGNYAAVPTILSGLADYSTIPHPATSTGMAHATMNTIGFVLQLISAAVRKDGNRNNAIALSGTATALLLLGAYLGGHLVYHKKVGVNHTPATMQPQDWTPVLAADALQEETPQRIEVEGSAILLYRQDGRILAIGAVCPHAGGPLEEGEFFDSCVQCPWHDSVFRLEDGRIVHGPSTYATPTYDVRIQDEQIEVRIAS